MVFDASKGGLAVDGKLEGGIPRKDRKEKSAIIT
jgi:hypothetical protein